ncbi:AraC family transcriptional regulator [Dyella nitratireducens]|uniref:AraC family transcriptional regulator n=1 Tax=Dyella nitratireducens TaxID=1849580 RepID=A0ABQ1GWL6_9GAMM|nr:AraC family transcriptional regulator [Dyella nitratireducens]GGA51838.1 AraC family transcriptional regulator [Dyella nitratireducens]GLQ41651.1 AraC family transcriptional regulator [Dyella nitratireducens]
MNTRPTDAYLARFQKVFTYIDEHLHEELTVARLSAVAAFSKHHFLRQFSDLFGIGVYKYVQLSRLKRASYQLAFRDDQPVIEIALDSGYDNPESFARAFKKSAGQTPTEFRKQPRWEPWHGTYEPLTALRTRYMHAKTDTRDVRIMDFAETRIAVLEHRGDPNHLGDSIRSFIAWRKQHHLHPSRHATFNIFYDDPYQVAPEDYRMDLCVAVDRDIAGDGIVDKIIPAGRCAVLRHMGSDDHLYASISYLYSEWLPHSGEEPRDFPLFVQRVRFFPDVPEHEAVVDIFLPLK